jgi:arylsulfate sulfotransferase
MHKNVEQGPESLGSDEAAKIFFWRLKTIFLTAVLAACAFLAGCGSSNGTGVATVNGAAMSSPNPLVAQFVLGSRCSGQAMVEFGPDTTYGRSTATYAVTGGQPLTILVAGMRASTTYHMRPQLQCNGTTLTGPDTTFTTGALPATPFPTLTISRPSPSTTSPENPGIELVDTINPYANLMQTFFTDRDANPIWYYELPAGYFADGFKLLPNGHVLFNMHEVNVDSRLREIDLAGNVIRDLTVAQLTQKMQDAGLSFGPNVAGPIVFHHDILPLDNGHIIALGQLTQNFTDLPGYPGTTQVIGDGLVDLDENWNPVWVWSSFDHLDVNRHLFGLPDWTHSNAIVYSPTDGSLLLSMRHQSWVIKIDYNNGVGSGNVLWRLGYQGDFALTNNGVPTDDPSLWFSFQHFPSLVSQTGPQTTLAIWDNGDYRPLDTSGTTCVIPGPVDCYSRATVFQADESAMVANLVWEDAPGYFSVWGGSINQLPNGNVEFDLNAPIAPPSPNVASEVQEVTQTVPVSVVWKMDVPLPMNAYRAYRVPSLYPGVTWQY